jgi:uncharacterized protein (TIGR02466 family)
MTIFSWFGLPIYESQLNVPPKVYDGMIQYVDNYYQQNKSKISKNKLLTGDVQGNKSNITYENKFLWLTNKIGNECYNYLNEIGVYTKDVDLYIQKSWPVCCESGGVVSRHVHKQSHLSVVYYLQKDNNKSGALRLYRDTPNYISNLPVKWENESSYGMKFIDYHMPTNMLVIFPSTIEHEVTQYIGDSMRYSISADVMICAKNGIEDVEVYQTGPENWKKVPVC